MGLADNLLDALRQRLARSPRKPGRAYGEPGRILVDRHFDGVSAGLDIAREFEAAFPTSAEAQRRSGFDPGRDYDGERIRAADRMDLELTRTWQAGKPYGQWMADAAQRAGI